MKLITRISAVFVGLFMLSSLAYAFAPTPVKVVAEATQETAIGDYQVNNIDGVGNWNVPARLSESLEFWNVGEEGGAKYATATWTQTWIPEGNGEVVTEVVYNEAVGGIGWHREPSKVAPVIEPTVQTLTFSGGLDGTFTLPSGDVSRFKIVSDGSGGYTVTGSNLVLFVKNPEAFDAWKTEEQEEQPDSGMRFSGMTGQVEWRADDDPDGWKLCKMGDKLPVFAHIRTQEDSVAILSFSDMSTFVLKADSEVVIDSPPEKESKIKLVAGNIWANVKKMVRDGSMSMEMNQATAGIKGTTLVLGEVNGVSSLKVIEGKVEFMAKADGAKTMVEGGSMVSATAQGMGEVQTFDVASESSDWESVQAKAMSAGEMPTKNKLTYPVIGLAIIILILAGIWVLRRTKKA